MKIVVVGFGAPLKVTESLGYVQDMGMTAKEVERPDGTTGIAVKRSGQWHMWSAADRTKPLREAALRKAKLKAAIEG